MFIIMMTGDVDDVDDLPANDDDDDDDGDDSDGDDNSRAVLSDPNCAVLSDPNPVVPSDAATLRGPRPELLRYYRYYQILHDITNYSWDFLWLSIRSCLAPFAQVRRRSRNERLGCV